MENEPVKEGRPGDHAGEVDPDIPQDPGIPGPKVEEEQHAEPPSSPGRGFPGDDGRKGESAAEADESSAPGSMPPGDSP